MRRFLGTALIAIAVAGSSGAAAQSADLTKVLVGTWKGDVQMTSGTYPRTLVIKAVETQGRQRFVDAEYGGPVGYGGGSGALAPVDIQLVTMGSDIILRFREEDLSPVELSLYRDGRHLTGSVMAPSQTRSGGRSPAAIRLEKVE
jgi:hypothetical protein